MPSGARTLDELRREIDRIDDALHDLLMQRTAVVEQVARAKHAAPGDGARTQFFRPGREARILRRLLERHRGPFPRVSLLRIWREIMAGQLRVQTEIVVAVHAPEGRAGAARWDLARDQYGAAARYRRCARPQQVVAALRAGEASIGVLPVPEEDGEDGEEPWWPLLADDASVTPRILSRLPLVAGQDRPESRAQAIVIAAGEPDPSNEDRGCLLAESDQPTAAAAVVAGLTAAGFVAVRALAAAAGGRLHLIEAGGLVASDDPRLAAAARAPVRRVLPLGGYAAPVVADATTLSRTEVA